MAVLFSKVVRERIIWSLLIVVFLFATFPGKGGLEGDQREVLGLTNRTDNWGFIVPSVIGNWPNILGHWRFSLVALQLMIFWFGLWLLLRNTWITNKKSHILLSFLIFFSSVFVSQLWRDATLLALATFALGILSKSFDLSRGKRFQLLALAILTLHLAAMFKVLYGLILGICFVWISVQNNAKIRMSKITILLVVSSLTIVPFIVDKQLSKIAGLQKVYPEQQPIIFDLASNYCWGQSNQIINDAGVGLSVVLKPGYPLQSVCASLRPNSWDNLHSSPFQWEFSSPIQRITGENDLKMSNLRSKWFAMITRNPVDWIQTRFMYLGWTVTLSNAFVPQNSTNTWSGIVGTSNSILWNILFSVASFADKLRLSSILFAFGLVTLLIVRTAYLSKRELSLFISNSVTLIFALISMLAITLVTMTGFVASNGRYVLPYVILTYLLIMRSLGLRSPTQVQEST